MYSRWYMMGRRGKQVTRFESAMLHHFISGRTFDRCFFIVWNRSKVFNFAACADSFNIGHLTTITEVVINNQLIVVQIHGIDEHVDDTTAESRVKGITRAELAQPRTHFFLRVGDGRGDAQLGKVYFHVSLFRVKFFAAFHKTLAHCVGCRLNTQIHRLLNFAFSQGDLLFKGFNA